MAHERVERMENSVVVLLKTGRTITREHRYCSTSQM